MKKIIVLLIVLLLLITAFAEPMLRPVEENINEEVIVDTELNTNTNESEEVIVTISLQKTGDKIEIAGSWFNSPKLRGE